MFKTVIKGILLSSAVLLSGHTFASIPCTAEDLEKLPKHLRSEASLNGQSVKIEVTIPGDEFISRCAVSPCSVRILDAQAKIAYDIYLNRDGHPVMTRAHMTSL